jgi:hypothetical protein
MKKIQVIHRIKEIRKGKNAQRLKVVFEEGEPVYIIDKDRLYVGDNRTYGGNDAACKNHVVHTNSIPQNGVVNDFLYNKNTNCISVIDKTSSLINITDYECKLNNLDNLMNTISAKIVEWNSPENKSHIATDLDTITTEDNVLSDVPDTIDID